MNVFSFSAVATRIGPRPWTCSTCRNQLVRSKPFRYLGARGFSFRRGAGSQGHNNGQRQIPRAALYASAGVGAVGATAAAFTDDIKTAYEAAERAGRVAATLMICINEYGFNLFLRTGLGLIGGQLPNDVECQSDCDGPGRAECAFRSLPQAMRRPNLRGYGEEWWNLHQIGTASGRKPFFLVGINSANIDI